MASETKTKYEKYLLLADRDKFGQALIAINELLKESPKDAIYLEERGRMNMQLNRLDAAQEDCTKAINLNPLAANALRTRSYCYFMKKEYQKGVDDLIRALKCSMPEPTNMWPRSDHENLSKAYQLMGKKDLAMKERKLAMLDQLCEQAVVARDGAGLEKAIALADKVIAQDPKHLNALGFRGVCLNNLQRFKEAIDTLTRAIAVKPKAAPLYYLRADCYRESKMYDKAVQDYTKILEINPRIVMFKYAAHTGRLRDKFSHTDTDCVNVADIHFLRGTCYHNLKRYDLAVKDFARVVELDPKEYKGALACGNANFNMRKYNDSIKYYTQAITIKPSFWDAYTARAQVYELVGKSDKAIEDLTTIVNAHKQDAGAYLLRAQIYARSKQYQKALDDFSKIIQIAPSDDEAYRERADLYAKLGQYDKAMKDYDTALTLNSEDRDAIMKSKAAIMKKQSPKNVTR